MIRKRTYYMNIISIILICSMMLSIVSNNYLSIVYGQTEKKDVSDDLSQVDVPIGNGKINVEYSHNLVNSNLIKQDIDTDNILLIEDYDKDGLSIDEEDGYNLYQIMEDTDRDKQTGQAIDMNYLYEIEGGHEYKLYDVYDKENIPLDLSKVVIETLEEKKLKAPDKLRTASVTGSAIILEWETSGDDEEIVGYIVYRGMEEIATTIAPFFIDYNVSYGTVYSYAVKAFDSLGNLSEASNMVYANLIDIVPPDMPENLVAEAKNASTVLLSLNSSNESGKPYK